MTREMAEKMCARESNTIKMAETAVFAPQDQIHAIDITEIEEITRDHEVQLKEIMKGRAD
jgi:hypothetical protein